MLMLINMLQDTPYSDTNGQATHERAISQTPHAEDAEKSTPHRSHPSRTQAQAFVLPEGSPQMGSTSVSMQDLRCSQISGASSTAPETTTDPIGDSMYRVPSSSDFPAKGVSLLSTKRNADKAKMRQLVLRTFCITS